MNRKCRRKKIKMMKWRKKWIEPISGGQHVSEGSLFTRQGLYEKIPSYCGDITKNHYWLRVSSFYHLLNEVIYLGI